MPTVLFLCTGNYYRSRFAELYFRHLAQGHKLNWRADSRGLQLDDSYPRPLSRHTIRECEQLGVSMEPVRYPLALAESDLTEAQLTIAVKETEHRPLIQWKFPEWEDQIEYWEVHDIDFADPVESLPLLRNHVDSLVQQLVKHATK